MNSRSYLSKARLLRVVPALDSLRRYTYDDARHDLIGGVTVAAVAVPQAMAYAMIAGLPAEYGLYTAIVMTAVGALFDSSKQLINGPTNAISIAVLSAVGLHRGPGRAHPGRCLLLAFMVGFDPARHHAAATRRSHAVHLALGDRRLHAGRGQAAGARSDEEPARAFRRDGRRPRSFPVAFLADD